MIFKEELVFEPIEIKKFDWLFSISENIFDILKSSEKLVLFKKSEDEVIIFTKEKRDWFYHAICIEAWFNLNDIKNTKRGNDFVRKLNSFWQDLQIINWNKIKIPSKTRLREILKWKNFTVKFCI